MSAEALRAAEEKMRAAGVHDAAIAAFRHGFEALASGETGVVREDDIEPVDDLPRAADLPEPDPAALDSAVIIKLNGGLGTSMGMTRAKSLLEVKPGLSFLDLIARQVLALRERHGVGLPLLLMDSFRTQEDSLAVLAQYPDLAGDLPLDFVQNKEPKLEAETLEPAEWVADPELEWCPPGHGDIYPALVASGLLDRLLAAGYRTAFVSNADNLGAVLDPKILSWFQAERIPFLMESARRSESDRKGGHLALRKSDGRLVLRESAQTADEDEAAFQDITRHRYFNVNSLWIDLAALKERLDADGGALRLPLIVNRKTIDPGDSSSTPVIQLETAMGAAIEVFEGARSIEVGKERFAPVKTTNDLLTLRSDAYDLNDDWTITLAGGRDTPPFVDLDPAYFKLLADFERRFPDGPPSLVGCDEFIVRGDATF